MVYDAMAVEFQLAEEEVQPESIDRLDSFSEDGAGEIASPKPKIRKEFPETWIWETFDE